MVTSDLVHDRYILSKWPGHVSLQPVGSTSATPQADLVRGMWVSPWELEMSIYPIRKMKTESALTDTTASQKLSVTLRRVERKQRADGQRL